MVNLKFMYKVKISFFYVSHGSHEKTQCHAQ